MSTSAYQWAKPHALFGLKVIAAQPVQPIARPILQPGIGGSFNPAIFFASGEQGVWYDPSDTATLFQDSAGTTPVTAVEQPVGRILDKSGRGNHAFQSTSTSRPVLSARYNLLTKTEQFDDAVWVKTGSTATFEKINETAVSSAHFVSQGFSVGSYLISVELKAAEREYAFVGNVEHAVSVNLAAGTASVAVGTPTNIVITRLSDGHLRVSFTATYSVTTGLNIYPSTDGIWANRSYLGVVGNGIYARKADLRVTNDAAGQPAYQRVNTATDYDTTGFKPYLRFDGTDDWLQTNSINFTATDKMTVFAGVRKLSDAAIGVIAELSAQAGGGNNGTFVLHGQTSPIGYRYAAGSGVSGTAFATDDASVFTAPITSVITGISDFAGATVDDEISVRVNGAVPTQTKSGTVSAGSFGNHPLYIGRRGGTTLPFNGRIYGLIVRGAQSTAQQITNTENWLNQRTGAY